MSTHQAPAMSPKAFAKALLRYFAQGALIAGPILMTLYLLVAIVSTIDGWLHIGIPGLGVLLAVLAISGLGFVASSVIGRRLVAMTDGAMKRLPLVKILYSAIKDLIGAFVGDRKSFDQPVIVDLPGEVRALGFVTRDKLPVETLSDCVAVYFPQSYNFAGNLLVVPRARVTPLNVKSSDLMTFIVSGGVTGMGVQPRPEEGLGLPQAQPQPQQT